MMEKVQLILQLLHPYTFIPTSTVIREMRVQSLIDIRYLKTLMNFFALYHARISKRNLYKFLLTYSKYQNSAVLAMEYSAG